MGAGIVSAIKQSANPAEGQAMELDAQRDAVAFLGDPASHGTDNPPVKLVGTHSARVFLVRDRAYKLKRAVRYGYLDYSTLARREHFCRREFAINRAIAPELYIGVEAIRRRSDGPLTLGGEGKVVDWVLVMRRFDESRQFDRLARAGALTSSLVTGLADEVWGFHARAEPALQAGGGRAMTLIVGGVAAELEKLPSNLLDRGLAARACRLLHTTSSTLRPLLDRRRSAGFVRHCHGDLHLGNVCLFEGRVMPFDAIEFDDELACIDILYDLAFLLMDLHHAGCDAHANMLLNRYLDRAGHTEGLTALPFFMALRALIRAMVCAQSAIAAGDSAADTPDIYAREAIELMAPAWPTVIAVGGLSGCGKSTLAYGLAPSFGRRPGARVTRSDVIRKRRFGVPPEARLPAAAYGTDSSSEVYRALAEEAAATLAAGYSVIVDAVFARPEEREAIERVARAANVPFAGFWLDAPKSVLEGRILARRGGASDATVDVLHRQLDYDLGTMTWAPILAAGDEHAVRDRVLDHPSLALLQPPLSVAGQAWKRSWQCIID